MTDFGATVRSSGASSPSSSVAHVARLSAGQTRSIGAFVNASAPSGSRRTHATSPASARSGVASGASVGGSSVAAICGPSDGTTATSPPGAPPSRPVENAPTAMTTTAMARPEMAGSGRPRNGRPAATDDLRPGSASSSMAAAVRAHRSRGGVSVSSRSDRRTARSASYWAATAEQSVQSARCASSQVDSASPSGPSRRWAARVLARACGVGQWSGRRRMRPNRLIDPTP